MFILRTVIWLSLVILVLPTDAQQRAQFAQKARNSYQQVATYCDRNAQTCETGLQYWEVFKDKADYGMALAFSLISDSDVAGSEHPGQSAALQSSRGTLSAHDLASPWRGNRLQ